MSKESFKNRMSKLSDKELLAILEKREQYQESAIYTIVYL